MNILILLIRRAFSAFLTLALTITVSFFLMRLAPGGPFDQERRLPAEVMANLKQKFHLDKSLIEQFWIYVKGLTRGDFGPSMIYSDFSVSDLVFQGLWASMQIGLAAIGVSLVLGVLLGALAAVRMGGWLDQTLMAFSLAGIAIPTFILAPLMSLVLAVHLKWFAVAGWGDGGFYYLTLPVVALAIPQIGIIARLMRGSMADVLTQMHIRTAHAKGQHPLLVVSNHAFRQSLFPVISYLGPAMAAILTGSVVIERVFAIEGLGRHFVQGALDRDYPLVMGTVIVYTTFIMLFNFVADLLYVLIDPRIRETGNE
ncbi:ABC transporter permease subunit [Shimia sp. SDUM112013]|uniref:ABC transporter permease n=1 Tax=Shimia sp. SDUM112013 TaxID=3136160 RepID=UPI0032EE6071